jgi:chromosomal replication initiation ATPase DnaA
MSPESIIAHAAAVTGVPTPVITGRRRNVRASHSRFLAIAGVRLVHHWWSLHDLGDFFRRDHSSIVNATKRHRDLLTTDPAYARQWQQLSQDILPGTHKPAHSP